MRVGVLGPLLVEVDGRAVTPGGQRLRDVLAVLVQRRGRAVPAEVVLDVVWGDGTSTGTVAVVHTVIARLRRQLGPHAVRTAGTGYLVEATTTTDEDAFGELSERASRLRELGDPAEVVALQREALRQWRDAVPWGGVSDELVRADRARLTELKASLTEALVVALLEHPEAGARDEALGLASDLAASYPLRERPHQLAMVAAYRAHRQAEALEIYRALRQRMRRELGIEPTAATVQLHTRVLRQDPALSSVAATPTRLTVVHAQASVVPVPLSPLVGRQREPAAIIEALDDGCRLVTLAGPGGVGKTRVLLEVGARLGQSRRIAYVDLSGLGEAGPDEVAEALTRSLRAPLPKGPPLDAVVAALTDGPWLLLVDEAEWVVEAVGVVLRAVLDRAPAVSAVVTSRRPLQLDGELVLPLGPLSCPVPSDDPAAIRAAPAVQLLSSRLTSSGVQLDQDPETAALLSVIARRLDGLPLALELAAGQAVTRSLAELASLVEEPLDVQASRGPRSDRHRSLRETLRWSTERLDDIEREVLGRLTAFAGRFDADAARAVAGPVDADVADVVKALVRDGLVQVDRAGPARLEFRLLRTVRDLAGESLDAVGRAATATRHRRWYADRWRGQPRRDELIADVRDHHDDYLQALRSALDTRDAGTVADLALTMSRFWTFTSGRDAGLRWTSRVLDSGLVTRRDRGRLHAQRAALALHHDAELVLSDTEMALSALDGDADAPWLVTALMVRALEMRAGGDQDGALVTADRAVDVARGLSDERLTDALGVQAGVHAAAGSAGPAAAAIEDALARVRSSGSAAARIAVGSNLALALLDLDRAGEALALLDEVAPQVPDLLGSAPPTFFAQNRGWAALGCDRPDLAYDCFDATLGGRTPPRDRMGAETALGIACSLVARGDPSAEAALAEGLVLADEVHLRLTPGPRRLVDRARQTVQLARR